MERGETEQQIVQDIVDGSPACRWIPPRRSPTPRSACTARAEGLTAPYCR
ncbi:hypothetical protein I552_0149 [Mycobacterium xenopi 3993]|nr:hypothetical protein I552_0149 [Mycobacterium xenopi 3993]